MATKTSGKQPKNWTDGEYLEWAKGERKATVGDKDMANHYIEKNNLDENLTVEKVKEHAIAKLGAGATEQSPEEEQQTQASSETATKEEGNDPQASEEKAPAEPEAQTSQAPEVPQKREAVEEQDRDQRSQIERTIDRRLEEYDEIMKPGRTHSGSEGPDAQVMLYRTIQMVLRREGSEFSHLYSKLLNFIHERRKEHFEISRAFRYWPRLNMSNVDIKNFQRMLQLMISTSNPRTRAKTIEQTVDLEFVVSGFKSTEVQQRIIGFYKNL